MNNNTYQKLKSNPHYKISEKQKKQLEEEKQKDNPFAEFGQIPKHNTKIIKRPR